MAKINNKPLLFCVRDYIIFLVMIFTYGEKEIEYLMNKDTKLAACISRIGHIEREVETDLFSAVVHNIIAQQISTKAQASIWDKMRNELHTIDANSIANTSVEKLQSFGISFRKVGYIQDFVRKVGSGEFDLNAVANMPDEQAIKELITLKGVGVWTAEMILLFCLQRPNVFSFGDFGILRGLRMVYHHRKIDEKLFEKYRRRFSPYCSVASLYLWAVAGGAIPELKDCARAK